MKLSVIIPCYNIALYIERAVSSILSQSFNDIEIILVNDGSTDNTLDCLRKLAERDGRIQIVSQENRGVSAARNAGLVRAQGDWVLFVDGDDWIESSILSVWQTINSFSVDILIFGFIIHKFDGKNIQYLPPMDSQDMFIKYVLGSRLHLGGIFFRCSFLIERELRFNEQTYYGEDREFIMKSLLFAKNILTLPVVGYHYDMTRTGSAINNFNFNEKQLTSLSAIDRVVKFVNENGTDVENVAIGIHRCISTLYVYKRYLLLKKRNGQNFYDAMFDKRIFESFRQSIPLMFYRYVILYGVLKVIYRISPYLFRKVLLFF